MMEKEEKEEFIMTDDSKESPFFSIVVPVYNSGSYLNDCLSSIVNQTYGDFEVLIVYDESKDDSLEICERFASKDQRIRIIHQDKKGVFMARVIGYSNAKGRYVVSVDSDDAIRGDTLKILREKVVENDLDILIFENSIKEDFSPVKRKTPFEKLTPNIVMGKEELMDFFLTTMGMNALWRKCIRNGSFMTMEEALKCPYEVIGLGEDAVLSLKPIDMCSRWMYIREPLYFYRPNPGSVTHSIIKPGRWDQIKAVCRMTIEYGKKWDKDLDRAPHFENMAKTKHLDGVVRHAAGICRQAGSDEEFMSMLLTVRDDPLFEDLYLHGHRKSLKFKQAVFAHLLHKRRYKTIKLIRRFYV